MARATDPADTPASIRVCVLSGEVTEISKAAVLPVVQLIIIIINMFQMSSMML